MNLDLNSGLYGGAMASMRVAPFDQGFRQSAYAGYARAIADTSWFLDAGLIGYRWKDPATSLRHGYGETYVGLNTDNWHVRFAYDTHYRGSNTAATYLELERAYQLNQRWRLSWHTGWLHQKDWQTDTQAFSSEGGWYGLGLGSQSNEQDPDQDRFDLRVNLSAQLEQWLLGMSLEAAISNRIIDKAATFSLSLGF